MNKKLIIHHSPFIIRKSEGFTLVELLASIIVLVAVGSIITGIISSSLRGANKTNTIENIRQNGNYALAQMSKDIEYAQSFDENSTGINSYTDPSGKKYYISCFSPSPSPPPSLAITDITVKSASNIVTKYECNSSDKTLTAEGISPVKTKMSLIDVNSVSLNNCSFNCIQVKPTDNPVIKIKFELRPKIPSGLMENSNPPITFETSVTMRNYDK